MTSSTVGIPPSEPRNEKKWRRSWAYVFCVAADGERARKSAFVSCSWLSLLSASSTSSPAASVRSKKPPRRQDAKRLRGPATCSLGSWASWRLGGSFLSTSAVELSDVHTDGL